ncbi:hypothetical protein FH972_024870 [Carpinus fangiana]|uniref:Gylcosyl hydrolase 115 C-terminal domain-containing protein n=1 Tax=Carpinus fangiana TaxID=176857 RepID=A0A5N6KZC5_9ROSI|nr:hypothetical protein FH972_024870 [Carpinus fangiana]
MSQGHTPNAAPHFMNNKCHRLPTCRRPISITMPTIFVLHAFILVLTILVAGDPMPYNGGQTTFIASAEQPGSMSLKNVPIIVDKNDYKGVKIAVDLLSQDFGLVTGKNATITSPSAAQSRSINAAIIIGSLQNSSMIKGLVDSGKFNSSSLDGKWETWTTQLVDTPLKGIKRALVIIGSDKRGTMYGALSLSEQIGVSPWYWWADVTPDRNDNLYALDVVTSQGEPSVKYRGIFINDETPALTDWVHEKFGPVFNQEFYKHVFELLLRLKANFMWPAMWGAFPHSANSFFVDDSGNQQLADDYGIVMSTSHHEPMMRAMHEWDDSNAGSWDWPMNKDNVTKYFEYGAQRAVGKESYFTMSMRGEGDTAISDPDPVGIVTEVLKVQQDIIKDKYGGVDKVPQLLALYKEVQGYYDSGLQVPDHMTLLFADDNFGAIRRLPVGNETQRAGRSGIYFHMEYVGVPRSYKWINSNSYGRIWQQLQLAYHRGADQIWVFNVADIKPQEVPLSMALQLAWNISSISADTQGFPAYFQAFAAQQFGSTHASDIADLLLSHSRLVALRKHEHIESTTFSTLNYVEADTVASRWNGLLHRAQSLSASISESKKDAYFQLVLHPITASQQYIALRISQARNALYAQQRRNTANAEAKRVLGLFDADYELSEQYHAIRNGKWDRMMEQPHYGYADGDWHAPSRDMISGLCFVQNRQRSNPAVGQMGVAVEGTPGVRPGLINEDSDKTHPSQGELEPGVTVPTMDTYGPTERWFEIYTRGPVQVNWTAQVQGDAAKFMSVAPQEGALHPADADQRVLISVDWAKVPIEYNQTVLVDVRSQLGDFEQVRVPVLNRLVPGGFSGFVESDKHISIEAAHFQRINPPANYSHTMNTRRLIPQSLRQTSNTSSVPGEVPSSAYLDDSDTWGQYQVLPYLGRTPSGAVTLQLGTTPLPPSSALTYPFYLFSSVDSLNVTLYHTTTLDTDPENLLAYDIAIDSSSQAANRLLQDPATPGDLPPGWDVAVQDGVWKTTHTFQNVSSGAHGIQWRPLVENLALEKIVVDLGGVRDSYLGPPESYRA